MAYLDYFNRSSYKKIIGENFPKLGIPESLTRPEILTMPQIPIGNGRCIQKRSVTWKTQIKKSRYRNRTVKQI